MRDPSEERVLFLDLLKRTIFHIPDFTEGCDVDIVSVELRNNERRAFLLVQALIQVKF